MTEEQLRSEPSDIERFREWAKRYSWRQPDLQLLAERSDEELAAAIAGAKGWIGGRRWSWKIVVANYLLDGSYHS